MNALGKEFGIPVIDDCIEAFGSELNGEKTGNLGTDITVFSFQTVRLPNTIEGGALVFKNQKIYYLDQHILVGQFIGGMLLGAIWSPCVGPTLGAAIALASLGESLIRSTLIMFAYSAGVATLMIVGGYLARNLITRRRELMQNMAKLSQPIIGFAFFLVGVGLFFGINHKFEAWALDNMPEWLIFISVLL